MAQKRKQFKDLDLSNAFLFAAALEDVETCKLVLELILGTKVKLASVKAESTILYSYNTRMVRLDIYARDEMQVGYDLEMQGQNKGNLAKRSRYHQAEMDLSSLLPGEDFNDLKPGFVVFICTFDPFGGGLYRYTFEERCLETDMPLGDETRKIFLSTKGTNSSDVPKQLVDFLNYVEESTGEVAEQTNDQVLQQLHGKIESLKRSREWEARYMTLGEWIDDEKQEACEESRREGLKEGHSQLLTLISRMVADGNGDDIKRLENNEDFLNEMLRKYNL